VGFDNDDDREACSRFGLTLPQAPPFKNIENSPCSQNEAVARDELLLSRCRLAQVVRKLSTPLYNLECPQANAETKTQLRNLLYVFVKEQSLLRDAFQSNGTSAGDPITGRGVQFLANLEAYVNDPQKMQELTGALVVDFVDLLVDLANVVAQQDEEALEWLKLVRKGIDQLGADVPLETLLNRPPFEYDDSWNPGKLTRSLRDKFKHLLVIAVLVLTPREDRGNPALIKVFIRQVSNIALLIRQYPTTDDDRQLAGAVLSQVAVLFNQWEAILAPPDSTAANNNETLIALAHALGELSQCLSYAADRDWTGLATRLVGLAMEAAQTNGHPSMLRALTFVRTLLAMYQAGSVEEAKQVFENTLVEADSREKRFSHFAVDIAAMVGIQGSYYHPLNESWRIENGHGLGGGLYVPFGLQVSWPYFGMLFYPVDLGGYLAGYSDDSAKFRVQNAIRLGVAAYGRTSREIPIDVGAFVDYRPEFPERHDMAELRFGIFVGFELPLFTIH